LVAQHCTQGKSTSPQAARYNPKKKECDIIIFRNIITKIVIPWGIEIVIIICFAVIGEAKIDCEYGKEKSEKAENGGNGGEPTIWTADASKTESIGREMLVRTGRIEESFHI
jgi:hypothetical protein